jgi:hypothetical protein
LDARVGSISLAIPKLRLGSAAYELAAEHRRDALIRLTVRLRALRLHDRRHTADGPISLPTPQAARKSAPVPGRRLAAGNPVLSGTHMPPGPKI